MAVTSAFNHLLAFSLISASLLQQSAPQVPHIIASTSEWAITHEQFEDVLKTLPGENRDRFLVPDNRRSILSELIRVWVLSNEVRKKGFNVGTDYESQKAYYLYYAQQVQSALTEEAVRKYYEDHADDYTEVGFSHILILNANSPLAPYADAKRLPYEEAEKKAREAKAMLDNGGDWDEVCKKYSQDRETGDKGGYVGYLPKGLYDRSLEAGAFATKIGEISDVVGSVYGFHILKVWDRRVKPFSEVRDQVRQRAGIDEFRREVELRVKDANVKIDETWLFAQ